MTKRVVSVRVNKELWKQAKLYALEHNTTLGELVEQSLRIFTQRNEKEKGE